MPRQSSPLNHRAKTGGENARQHSSLRRRRRWARGTCPRGAGAAQWASCGNGSAHGPPDPRSSPCRVWARRSAAASARSARPASPACACTCRSARASTPSRCRRSSRRGMSMRRARMAGSSIGTHHLPRGDGVTRHPVRARDVDLVPCPRSRSGRCGRARGKAVDDGAHLDVVAHARHVGPEAADAADEKR